MTVTQSVFSDILKELPQLDSDQLRQIKDRTSYLLSCNGTGTSPRDSTIETCLLQALRLEMKRQKLPCPPEHVLLKRPGAREFKKSVPILLEFFNKAVPGIQRVDITALCCIGYRSLTQHFQQMKVPVGPDVLLRHSNRLPVFICQAFPGYAECGMLGYVIKSNQVAHPR